MSSCDFFDLAFNNEKQLDLTKPYWLWLHASDYGILKADEGFCGLDFIDRLNAVYQHML